MGITDLLSTGNGLSNSCMINNNSLTWIQLRCDFHLWAVLRQEQNQDQPVNQRIWHPGAPLYDSCVQLPSKRSNDSEPTSAIHTIHTALSAMLAVEVIIRRVILSEEVMCYWTRPLCKVLNSCNSQRCHRNFPCKWECVSCTARPCSSWLGQQKWLHIYHLLLNNKRDSHLSSKDILVQNLIPIHFPKEAWRSLLLAKSKSFSRDVSWTWPRSNHRLHGHCRLVELTWHLSARSKLPCRDTWCNSFINKSHSQTLFLSSCAVSHSPIVKFRNHFNFRKQSCSKRSSLSWSNLWIKHGLGLGQTFSLQSSVSGPHSIWYHPNLVWTWSICRTPVSTQTSKCIGFMTAQTRRAISNTLHL